MLSVSAVVGRAWDLVKASPGPVILLVVLSVLAEMTIQLMMTPIEAPVSDFFTGLFRGVPFLPWRSCERARRPSWRLCSSTR